MSRRRERRHGALHTLAGLGAGFAAGTIPTGELVTRALTGQRLRDLGDGKAGSSNVARSVGWKAGAAVLALDALKAYVPATAAGLRGAGDNEVAAIGVSAMCGHIAVVKGRGAASALGAAFAMDPAMMAVGCVPLVGGSLLHRHAEAVTVTALSLPVISLALHRSPRRALGPLAAHHRAVRGAPARLARRAAAGLARGPLEPVPARQGRALSGGAAVRVGLVSPYSWTVPGGVNHHVEHLADELEERGHETWIIAPVGAVTPARRSVDSRRQAMAERFIPMGSAVPAAQQRLARLRELSRRRSSRAWTAPSATAASTCCTCTSPARRWSSGMAVLMATSPGRRHLPRGPRRVAATTTTSSSLVDHGDAPHRRARRRERGRAGRSRRAGIPGPYRIIPNGVPVEKYAPAVGAPKVRGRILFVGRAERRKGLGVLLQAFTLLRERAAARDAGRRRRHAPAGARDRPQRHRAARGPGRRGGAGLGRRRGEDRPAGGGARSSARRRWRPRASASCWPRRWPPACRWSPRTCRATARCCATGRPGGSRRPATPSRSPTRCTTCCRTRRSGGA